jgi:hypothetical protein
MPFLHRSVSVSERLNLAMSLPPSSQIQGAAAIFLIAEKNPGIHYDDDPFRIYGRR